MRHERLARGALAVAGLASLSSWRSALESGPVDAVFIASEMAPDPEEVGAFAEHLIRSGVFCVSCWGRGCELIHEIFDETEAWLDSQTSAVGHAPLMTTWHDDEPLSEALNLFLELAGSVEGRASVNALALAIGSDHLLAAVREAASAR